MKCERCEPVEEDEAGHLLYAVLVGELAVGRLDEVDVLPVGVVVDVLQRLQDGQASRALLLLVWTETTSFRKLFSCNSDNSTTRRGLVSLSSSSDTHCIVPLNSHSHTNTATDSVRSIVFCNSSPSWSRMASFVGSFCTSSHSSVASSLLNT